jgi:hypothetical protein
VPETSRNFAIGKSTQRQTTPREARIIGSRGRFDNKPSKRTLEISPKVMVNNSLQKTPLYRNFASVIGSDPMRLSTPDVMIYKKSTDDPFRANPFASTSNIHHGTISASKGKFGHNHLSQKYYDLQRANFKTIPNPNVSTAELIGVKKTSIDRKSKNQYLQKEHLSDKAPKKMINLVGGCCATGHSANIGGSLVMKHGLYNRGESIEVKKWEHNNSENRRGSQNGWEAGVGGSRGLDKVKGDDGMIMFFDNVQKAQQNKEKYISIE